MKIIDTSVWISLFNPKDSNNNKAQNIFLDTKAEEIVMFDYVYTESMNVFRAKFSDDYCINFSQFLNYLGIPISIGDPIAIQLANIYFFRFKKLSFTDCLILASAKTNNHSITTFDKALREAALLAFKV